MKNEPEADFPQPNAVELDDATVTALIGRHRSMVYRVCLRMLGNHHDAEDATQATFVVLMRKHGFIRQGANISAWLYGVARKVSSRVVRRRIRQPEAPLGEMADLIPAEAAAEFDAEERALLLAALDAEIAALSANQREAVILRYLEGFSQEEAARRVGCPVGTFGRRAHDGLLTLRKRLEKRGFSLPGAALSAVLAAETAATIPETLQVAIMATLKVGNGSLTTALNLAHDTIRAMFWAKVKTVATVVVAVATVGGSGIVAAHALTAANQPLTPAIQEISAPVMVTPRTCYAWEVFDNLARHGGARVVMMGDPFRSHNLLVPAELRFHAMEGRRLIEAVAAEDDLKVAWVRDGRFAVLFTNATDGEIERLKTDLSATDPSVRREAATHCGWLQDPRIVPLLLKAARETDTELARRANESMRRIGWAAVLALDDSAQDLLAVELDSKNERVRCHAIAVLGRIGAAKAMPQLEKALTDTNAGIRAIAVWALGDLNNDRALALIERAVNDANPEVRGVAIRLLGIAGGDKELALIKKALSDPDVAIRGAAISALGAVGNDKALALIEKGIADNDSGLRRTAAVALGSMDSDRARALIVKLLADRDAGVRIAAAQTLGKIGGEKSLPSIEKTLSDADGSDADGNVRSSAAAALGFVGTAKAQTLIEKLLVDPDVNLRRGAANALGKMGGKMAMPLFEKALADKDVGVRFVAATTLAEMGWEKALPLLEKMLSGSDPVLRYYASFALRNIGGEKARNLLLRQLAVENDTGVRDVIRTALKDPMIADVAVEKQE